MEQEGQRQMGSMLDNPSRSATGVSRTAEMSMQDGLSGAVQVSEGSSPVHCSLLSGGGLHLYMQSALTLGHGDTVLLIMEHYRT